MFYLPTYMARESPISSIIYPQLGEERWAMVSEQQIALSRTWLPKYIFYDDTNQDTTCLKIKPSKVDFNTSTNNTYNYI